MDWDRLRVFKTVANAGSFTAAMRVMNLSQSAISRNISTLEDSLGVILFHRHARGLKLTEQGALLLETTNHVFQELERVQVLIGERKDKASGQLKITAPHAFGTTWLADQMKYFLAEYPEINVDLLLCDEELDLGMGEADVAIRLGKPHQQDLIQRPLVAFRLKVYAAKTYLEEYGEPASLEDLERFQLILFERHEHYGLQDINWLEKKGMPLHKKRRARLRVDSLYGMYRAVRSGLGIASLPDYMARDPASLELKQILPELEGPETMSYFVYPQELKNTKRVVAFREFLLSKLESLK
ncbi:MAG: LysR family transcriptional regulator [Alphaproteobacteria bacterium]